MKRTAIQTKYRRLTIRKWGNTKCSVISRLPHVGRRNIKRIGNEVRKNMEVFLNDR